MRFKKGDRVVYTGPLYVDSIAGPVPGHLGTVQQHFEHLFIRAAEAVAVKWDNGAKTRESAGELDWAPIVERLADLA